MNNNKNIFLYQSFCLFNMAGIDKAKFIKALETHVYLKDCPRTAIYARELPCMLETLPEDCSLCLRSHSTEKSHNAGRCVAFLRGGSTRSTEAIEDKSDNEIGQ